MASLNQVFNSSKDQLLFENIDHLFHFCSIPLSLVYKRTVKLTLLNGIIHTVQNISENAFRI